MIIYKSVNSWNVNIFPNCSIFEFCYFSKLNNLKNLMFFEIGIFGKLLEFYKLQVFGIFTIENCSNCKFSKFEFFGISQIGKLRNFEILFNLGNQSLTPKIGNFGIVHPFDIPHYSQFCQFSYLPFDINQFRRFNFSTFILYSSRNFLY